MRKRILIAIVLGSIARLTSAANATSPAVAAARQLASQTLAEMEAHATARVLGGPIVHPPAPRAPQAVDAAALRAAIADPDLDIFSVSASAFALGLSSPGDADAAVEELLEQMNRAMFANPDVQHHLLVALGARAVPALVRHLNDSMVLDVLADIGADASGAVPALKAVLGTRNVEAAATLVAIGTDEAVAAAMPVLVRVAGDPHDPWAKEAAIALGRTRRQAATSALPVLRRLLSTPDPDTRLYAAVALVRLGDAPTGARALGSLVRSEDVDDPWMALKALREMGRAATPARDDLIAFTLDSDEEPEQRAAAASTLATIAPRDSRVISALRRVAADPAVTPMLSTDVMRVAQPE